MTTPPRGIDVSSWQHPGGAPIDWAKVAAAGYRFALLKATQGTTYTSPYLREDYQGARSAGLIVGAYHYYDLAAPPDFQGEYFCKAIDGMVLDLHAWLDWEPPYAPGPRALARAFLARCAAYGRSGVGVYADSRWMSLLVGVPGLRWLAAPSLTQPPSGVMIWQHGTGLVPGITGPVDLDVLLSHRGVDLPAPARSATPPPAPTSGAGC